MLLTGRVEKIDKVLFTGKDFQFLINVNQKRRSQTEPSWTAMYRGAQHDKLKN